MVFSFSITSMVIAFSLGLSCSLMPCCLPILLGYIGFLMKKVEKPTRLKSTLIGITFTSGIMISIILIGLLFSFIGSNAFQIYDWIKYVIAGIIILLGLSYLLGYEPKMPFIHREIKKKGFKGAFLQGSMYGVGTSGCAVLMLSALILYSFTIQNFGINLLNFIFFGIGRSVPLIVISLLVSDTQQRVVAFFTKHSKLFSKLPGLLILIAGIAILIFSIIGQ